MRRRLSQFLRLLGWDRRALKSQAVILSAPRAAPLWTEVEALEWRKFLSSSTGLSLLGRARALESANALRGCQDAITSTHSAGRAAGFSDAINWLESLSRVTGDQVTTSEHPPQGEPDLLEMMSP